VDTASAGLAMAMNASLPILNRARADLGLPVLADIMDLFDRADRLLLATSPAVDFQADSLPDNFRYVGPLLGVASWSKSLQPKSRQAQWSSQSERPRVLVACSTGAQGHRDLFQRVLDAIGTIDVEALATTARHMHVA